MCLSMTMIMMHLSPVAACFNDRDTHRTEREFRTNYEYKPTEVEPKSRFETPAVSEENNRSSWTVTALTLSGVGMLCLTCGLVTMRGFRS
jgi:hypothetical protein